MTEYALYAKGTNHEITQSKSTQFIAALTADLLINLVMYIHPLFYHLPITSPAVYFVSIH